MQYTAIIKDGGLFIPNVFSDLNDGGSHIVQVEVDIAEVRQQLSSSEASKTAVAKKSIAKAAKKPTARPTKKDSKKPAEDMDLDTLRQSAVDELEGLDDSELSEIFKAYMNDGQESSQISLENL
ncbi:hypothetical protein IOD06_01715 [Psychrobacter sp. N25K4-3-2]|uniref:hypothetical protein n=1 Tax=Psychrobacter sp. N25K4-3-2 TaxID=2785026 RepID=UPI00188A0FB7|nr:hypothetical protein [Psychrobacter sp. N25K4-3-2]MBF4488609.1 hypothetical protein [Psychrobacter sp. N25K4-3-2]